MSMDAVNMRPRIEELIRRVFAPPPTATDEPFTESPLPDELARAVADNRAYRRVLRTDPQRRSQQVAMYLRAGQSIGWEQHADTTQYFAVVGGSGTLYSARTQLKATADVQSIRAGSKWLIESRRWHDVEAGADGLQLLTMYFPAEHAAGTVEYQ